MDKKQEKELVAKIKSNSAGVIDESIKLIREEGGILALTALMDVYASSSLDEQKKISQLFYDLRDEQCIPVLTETIKNTEDLGLKRMLLTACWQNRLNFIQYLEVFILIVIAEPFEYSFEAFTVIENMDSKVSEGRKKELIAFVKDNISSCSDDTMALAHDLVGIIENYEEG